MSDASARPTAAERATARQLLEDTRAELKTFFYSLEARQWNAAAGNWTVAGVLEHLAIVEQRSSKLLHRMLAEPAHAGWEELLGNHGRLAATETVTQPSIAPPVLNPTGLPPEQALADFDAGRDAKLALLNDEQAPLHQHAWPHPVLGPLSAYQWLLATAHHTRRHLAQMRKAITS